MAATRNIMSSALFSMPFLGYQPVNISNGEPALTVANLTKQTILGAPFAWAWNRSDFEADVTTTEQDYLITAPDFGFLEKAWLIDSKGNAKEVKIVLVLAEESSVQRPQSVAVQEQNDDGTILLRLNAMPDQAYTLAGCYQKAPALMTSMASSWAPIPDSLAYIYDYGFLYFVSMLTKDARSPFFGQKFVGHLLGAQQGLTAMQRNIFLGNFLGLMTEQQQSQATTSQGVQARQV
jgi:hypothetical protein